MLGVLNKTYKTRIEYRKKKIKGNGVGDWDF